MKKFRLNKAALSIATAVLMVTSMLSMFAGSAATPNEVTLSADKEYVSAGDRINVSVGFSPNDKGAAGMTLNLHYDPSKVSVHIPTQAEHRAQQLFGHHQLRLHRRRGKDSCRKSHEHEYHLLHCSGSGKL